MSEYYNHLNQVQVNLPNNIVINRVLVTITKLLELRDELYYARDNGDDSQALRNAEIDEGRNQEKHQVLMVDKDHQFQEKGKGKMGNFKKNGKQVAAQVKKPKSGPKPETECFYYKGTGHQKGNCPKYLADKKDGEVNKGIFDIHVIDVYFTSVYRNPSVFDTSSVAKISNSKRELQNKQRLAKGEVTTCVGSVSKDDMITITRSLYLRDQC